MPLFVSAGHGRVPPVDEVRDLIDYLRTRRGGDLDPAFDVVLGGTTPPDARDLLGPLAEAGATWWDERQPIDREDVSRLEPVLRRIKAGPPPI